MKFVVSGYDNKESIAILEINKSMEYTLLDTKSLESPTFVVEGNRYIYTYEKRDGITLHSYLNVGEELIEVAKKKIGGTDLTHLVYSPKNKALFGCSYHEGTIFSVKIMQGTFGSGYQYKKVIEDDRLSRAHCVVLNESQTELVVVNIAVDELFIYDLYQEQMTYKESIQLPQGCGPRHAIFDEDNTIYVVTEYSNEVMVIDRESKEVIQRISSVPHFKDKTYGATLLFSKDKTKLYASNRGEDSIAVFDVSADKRLHYLESFSCGGAHPRHMILSNDGEYILSCNKNENTITCINLKTKEVVVTIPFASPSGIVEIF